MAAPPKVAGFVPVDLPLPKLGLDVVSPEGDLPEGAVRRAVNVMLHDNGGWDRRPGYAAHAALPQAHSMGGGANGNFVVAEGVLYQLNAGVPTAVYSGLPAEDPVEYAEIGRDVYCTSNGQLRQLRNGVARWPGVALLLGQYPSLTPTTGSMRAARYGVAYSLVNDLGVESGISSVSFCTGTGILVSGLMGGTNITHMKLYATHPDGEELFLYQRLAWAPTAAIVDSERSIRAANLDLLPMPGGEFVRQLHGRLYVAFDVWLFYSPPFAPGLNHVHDGVMSFDKVITFIEPAAGGLYVGFADSAVFLRGSGPENFVVEPIAIGGIAHASLSVPADLFTPELAGSGKELVVWLSTRGVVLGRADGSVVLPQAARIRLSASRGRAAVLLLKGIRQLLFTAEDLVIAEPNDDTTLAYLLEGATGGRGHGTGHFVGAAIARSHATFRGHGSIT